MVPFLTQKRDSSRLGPARLGEDLATYWKQFEGLAHKRPVQELLAVACRKSPAASDSVPAPTYARGMDLAASIVTAAATVVLAVVAFCQIRAGREQATEARKQATKALEIATAQAHSTVTIARETREAAERQWQPRVFARYHGEAVPAGEGFTVAPDEIAVPYYLINEGTGPAFNVQVGIEVGEQVWWREFEVVVHASQRVHPGTRARPPNSRSHRRSCTSG